MRALRKLERLALELMALELMALEFLALELFALRLIVLALLVSAVGCGINVPSTDERAAAGLDPRDAGERRV